jgi:hypothetical protein
MHQLYLAEMPHTHYERKLVPLRLNLDIRKRGFDPFFSGVAVGAMATLVGLLLGWFLLPI